MPTGMRSLHFLALVVAATARSNSKVWGSVELTKENFAEKISGKNAFVEFLAPWWGHCINFKPTWEKLGAAYARRPDIIIGAADCTGSGRSLCQDIGIYGYPTIKYFDADGEHTYSGSRQYADLKKFVEENLVVRQPCLIDDLTTCSAKEKKYIAEMKFKDAYIRTKHMKRLMKIQRVQSKNMAPALKEWSLQQLAILKQF